VAFKLYKATKLYRNERNLMITITDYGVGNLASLINIFDFIGIEAISSSDPEQIASASRIILPGVGSFDRAMKALHDSALVPALEMAVFERSVPVLGICLGMHLMAHGSEEGELPGLGWIDASARRILLPQESTFKVPNNGWHRVLPRRETFLFPEKNETYRYYFNHAYHLVCTDSDTIAGEIEYGARITCAIERGNIFGVQFHPEKSHRFGVELLARFAGVPAS